MNTREQLNQYLRGLESRLRLLTWSRGAAIACGVAFGATLALVFITNAYAFSDTSMVVARVVLFLALAVAIAVGLVIPLLKLNEHRAADKAEQVNPAFQQRLLTYIERRNERDPMMELLAEDTLQPARQAAPTTVVPPKSVFAFATGAGAAGALLIAMMFMPGYLGFGARKLWAGAPKVGEPSFYGIKVEPGSETLRRRTDLSVVATLRGFTAPQVRLMAKYDSAAKWEEMPMTPRPGESSYGYLVSAVPEGLQYYVEAAGVKSETFQIKVVDLPGIKNIKVTYQYPNWMHKQAFVEDPGGDLRAVTGTTAELTIQTDKPLSDGLIVMQDGMQMALSDPTVSGGKNLITGRVPILKNGAYHFAAKVNGEVVRLTSDYFIEALEDQGPKVSIKHPGADAHVNPIEEVVVNIQATDDFGVNQLQLHYSVNGEPEKTINLAANGTPQVDGSVTLALEDFKMIPGDVVTMYATAKDARVEASSDVLFVQAMAFEKNYSQSQQEGGRGGGGDGGGGGGGGDQDPNQISRRQRDLISLTNKAIRGTADDKAAANKERAEFMAERQTTLQQQAESLAQRVEARQLDDESAAIKEMVKEIRAAGAAMGPAAKDLSALSWEKAMVSEREALTHLQRAEEINRDIQVAFGNQGQQGGGGGGGQNAGRDLANLFDLELDTEKNQYEQAQSARNQGGGQQGQQQQQVDDAMKKLEELARRAQQAADQAKQQQGKQQTVDRRWDQEQLRRDIEELQKQIQQLEQQMAQQGQQQNQQKSGQQSKSGQQGGQSAQSGGQQSAQQRQLQQLQQQLERAQQNIRDSQAAANQGKQGESNAAQQRAAEALNQANQQAAQAQKQGTEANLDQLQKKAEALADQQRKAENQLKQMADGKGDMTQAQREAMGQERQNRRDQFQQLQRDINSQAQQLRQQSPDAARELRDALSAADEAQTDLRLEYGQDYVRRGTPSDIQRWLPNETPIARTMEEMAQGVRDARSKIGTGGKQGNEADQDEKDLAALTNARQSLERALEEARRANQQGQNGQGKDGQGKQGDGKQGGQGKDGQAQSGQGKDGQGQGKGGQGKDGQAQADGQGKGQGKGGQGQGKDGQGQGQGKDGQGGQGGGQGGQQQANGQQPGQGQPGQGGGPNGGIGGYYDQFGRFYPQGMYDRDGLPPVDPRQTARDLQRDLGTIREANKGNREIATQIQGLERELQNLAVGNPSGPELENRLSRAILPQLESLEVQLRQELDKEKGGQARSAATDRTPAGFAEDVAEYYRRLGRAK